MMEDQQLPKTNAEWANYYESIIAELTENQKNILMPPSAFGPDGRTSLIWKKAQAEQAELIRLRSSGKSRV